MSRLVRPGETLPVRFSERGCPRNSRPLPCSPRLPSSALQPTFVLRVRHPAVRRRSSACQPRRPAGRARRGVAAAPCTGRPRRVTGRPAAAAPSPRCRAAHGPDGYLLPSGGASGAAAARSAANGGDGDTTAPDPTAAPCWVQQHRPAQLGQHGTPLRGLAGRFLPGQLRGCYTSAAVVCTEVRPMP